MYTHTRGGRSGRDGAGGRLCGEEEMVAVATAGVAIAVASSAEGLR